MKLGIANTRMKDFYDLEILSRTFALEGKTLSEAIQNTFQKRGTDPPMESLPVAFTSEFYHDRVLPACMHGCNQPRMQRSNDLE